MDPSFAAVMQITLGRLRAISRSAVAKSIGVSVECGRAAEMGIKHLRSRRKIVFLDEVDHALHGFSLIDRIGDHAFQPRAEPDSLLGLLGRTAAAGTAIVFAPADSRLPQP